MNPDYMNRALAMTGAQYRVPQQQIGQAQSAARANADVGSQVVAQRDAESRAQKAAGGQKAWGLINTAANLYTGGAFGAVTGGVGKDANGNVGMGNLDKAQGGGAGGLLGAAGGVAGGLGGGGAGGAQGGGGMFGAVKPADYSQYELGNRMGGSIYGGR